MKQKIRDLLVDFGDGPDRASILAALRLLAIGIQTGDIRQEHAVQCVATAMGYLVAGRRLEAGWWARQGMSGIALAAPSPDPSIAEALLSGIDSMAQRDEQLGN